MMSEEESLMSEVERQQEERVESTKPVYVWDIPLRVFHWGLVLAVFGAWLTAEVLEDMTLHFYCGYVILALMLFRLVWGFCGPQYSRFSSLQLGFAKFKDYSKTLRSKAAGNHAGHNPMGSWSVVVMLTLLIVQSTTGLFSSDDYLSGPLHHYLEDSLGNLLTTIHHSGFTPIKVMVLLHLCAVIYYQFFKRERIIDAMFCGKKQLPGEHGSIESSRLWLGLAIASVAAAAVYGIVLLEPEVVSFDW